ncbi:GNAT family N-acetyltransferase [Tenacibaculum sp. SG-28]|uniref:GNAT family N-acetyltransferase n=1 Tax=Tenacibaculum sp. SG-28 TaxID=754426 RepID=UPI000CF464AC|nr:GNAT family N-acetyltransferase [Tenacibaculum sp. SG-28]PQJ23398.1 GNAT family N-acetyltransferase [Tenacibaculum sp. SG-28]
MTPFDFIIREIKPADNAGVAQLIRSVLIELNVPKTGTAYEDKATDEMFATYQNKRACYFVIEYKGEILGGAGIGPLEGQNDNVCELQKMYFSPSIRGKGLGSKLITQCLEKAKEYEFKQCYIETMPYMHAAQKLYKKNGFHKLSQPMGNTGHYSCTVWMLKDL